MKIGSLGGLGLVVREVFEGCILHIIVLRRLVLRRTMQHVIGSRSHLLPTAEKVSQHLLDHTKQQVKSKGEKKVSKHTQEHDLFSLDGVVVFNRGFVATEDLLEQFVEISLVMHKIHVRCANDQEW